MRKTKTVFLKELNLLKTRYFRNIFIKISLFSFAASCIATAFASPVSTTICQCRDNKASAVVLTTDDGLLNSVQYYVSQWKIHNLRGTAAIIVSDVSNWQPWIDMVEEGYLDIGNHSMNHPFLPDVSVSELDNEINSSKNVIESNIPGFTVTCFLCPGGGYNDNVIDVIRQQHYANRVIDHGYNSFSPTEDELFRLKRQQIFSATTADEMNGWIDEAINLRQWAIEAFHGCGGEGYEPPPCETLAEHYAYIASRRDSIWCPAFSEIVKYIRERLTASITDVSSGGNTIILELTDEMDDGIFNEPLTLETELPADWDSPEIVQNGNTLDANVYSREGSKYVMYDAIPDAGEIEISSGSSDARNRSAWFARSPARADKELFHIYSLKGQLCGTAHEKVRPLISGKYNAGVYIIKKSEGVTSGRIFAF